MPRRLLRLARLFILIGLLGLGLTGSARGQEGKEPLQFFAVQIAASTREQRTAITRHGLAIDAVSDDAVIVTVSEEELQRLREQGFHLLDVRPLQFPIDDEDYHDFAEMVAEIEQAVADHPDIVQLSVIGQSIEGRDLYAVKISDNVTSDEAEPEILLFALTHAREHLTTEQALDLIAYFSDNYGLRGDITNLVNEREIWILPNVNPDGDEYDRIGSGWYRSWRKNRRDNGDSNWGVDLNRNYDYRWGYDNNGSSPFTGSQTYRGPAAFSEPETQAIRDFALDHPDLVTSISFHTYGELILWPYGYTYEDVPADMDPDDHATFVEMGRAMAALNGYTAQQASDLYPTNGDSDDWLYGEQGIFAFTFELYPTTPYPGFYPDDNVIPAETARNRGAVSYLIGVSDNPRKVIGQGGDVTQPSVELVAPTAGAEISGMVELNAIANDDVGVTLVEFLVDGAITIGLDATAPYTITWDSSTSLGRHLLTVRAYDHGHNVGVSAPVAVTVVVSEATPTATSTVTPTPTATPTATPTPTMLPRVFVPLVSAGEGQASTRFRQAVLRQ